MPTRPEHPGNWYEKALKKWALMLVDEIYGLMDHFKNSLRRGYIQEALQELHRVLVLASEDELASEVQELKRMLDEVATSMMVREGYYYQTLRIRSIERRVRETLDRVRRRLDKRDPIPAF